MAPACRVIRVGNAMQRHFGPRPPAEFPEADDEGPALQLQLPKVLRERPACYRVENLTLEETPEHGPEHSPRVLAGSLGGSVEVLVSSRGVSIRDASAAVGEIKAGSVASPRGCGRRSR